MASFALRHRTVPYTRRVVTAAKRTWPSCLWNSSAFGCDFGTCRAGKVDPGRIVDWCPDNSQLFSDGVW